MLLRNRILQLSLLVLLVGFELPADVFVTRQGNVHFISEAPLETIEATSTEVGAVLNRTNKTVAFQVPITSFEGFNSALQQEHFHENYMESDDHPKSVFNGKIIEDVDLTKDGIHRVRAKGMLEIHGIEKERIIPGTITVKGNTVRMQADFEVTLADYQISIPRIVTQKIAEVVQVNVDATLKPKA